MARFLPSPVFAFSQRVVEWFDEYVETLESPTNRILMHPIAEGVRFRNLAEDRSATLMISGALITLTLFLNGGVKDTQWHAEDELDRVCEIIVTHFISK